MKVLHIITRLEKGGSAKNTLASLSVDGFDNFLVYGPCVFSEKIENSSKIFEASHLSREICPHKDLIALIEIYFLIKKIKPDIVHTHTSKAGILGRMAAFIYNLPSKKALVIHTPHGHLFYGYYGYIKTNFFKAIERIFSKITDFYIALTEGEKIESIEAGLGNQKKWTVINSGIDFPQKLLSRHEARSQFGLPEKAFIAAYVGRLEYVKGPDIFLEIVSSLKKYEDAPSLYIIVGDGSMRKELEKFAIKKSILDKILFLGHRENIFELLRALDFIIQPSRNEAMGRTVIEAQYCGLPVVASDACWFAMGNERWEDWIFV